MQPNPEHICVTRFYVTLSNHTEHVVLETLLIKKKLQFLKKLLAISVCSPLVVILIWTVTILIKQSMDSIPEQEL